MDKKSIKTLINETFSTNGQHKITGEKTNTVMNDVIDFLDDSIAETETHLEESLQEAVSHIIPVIIEGDVTNQPDEEDLTSENERLKFKDRDYNSLLGTGLGYVILRKSLSFSDQITEKANTVFEVRYDFDLNGETVSLPNNCILKMCGGKIYNGTLSASTKVTIDGYNCLCTLNNANNFIFSKPYHVSTVTGLTDGTADGSEAKPFYYLQQALDVCNNIEIERESFLWINQLKGKNITSASDYCIGLLKYNTRIGVYGIGRNPCFTGFMSAAPSSTEDQSVGDVHKVLFDYSGRTATFPQVKYRSPREPAGVALSSYPMLCNFNLGIDNQNDAYNSLIGARNGLNAIVADEATALSLFSENILSQCVVRLSTDAAYNSTDWLKFYLYYKTSSANYQTYVAADLIGINANRKNLVISNCDFEFLTFGVNNTLNINVDSCNFQYIGGAVQPNFSSFARYGNAIETYLASTSGTVTGFIVKNSTFNTIFDAGITVQGTSFAAYQVRVTNNRIYNTRMGVEFFDRPSSSRNNLFVLVKGNTFADCRKDNPFYIWFTSSTAEEFAALRVGEYRLENVELYENLIINSQLAYGAISDLTSALTGCTLLYNKILIDSGEYIWRGFGRSDLQSNVFNAVAVEFDLNNPGSRNKGNKIYYRNSAVSKSSYGSTANRPANPKASFQYFDTTLGMIVIWNGSRWVDAAGQTAAPHTGSLSDMPKFLAGTGHIAPLANDVGFRFYLISDPTYGTRMLYWNTWSGNNGAWVEFVDGTQVPVITNE